MTQHGERRCGAILCGRVQKFWLILLQDISDGLRCVCAAWACVYVIANEVSAARSL